MEEIKGEEPFDEEKLEKVWEELKVLRKKSEMEVGVLSRPKKLHPEHEIELFLSNTIELGILERMEQDIVLYIRKTLNNGKIKLKSTIKEQDVKDKLYTDRDKFAYMIKKNPDLQNLKDILGLDLEF